MPKSNNSFLKKQRADIRSKKKKQKLEDKLAKKTQPKSGNLEDMMAYIDEFGNISTTPPPPPIKEDSRRPRGNRNDTPQQGN
jgi:hypothetical protein